MATRKMLVDAKSQQRPEARWLVIGEPSMGTFMLKVCVVVVFALGLVRVEGMGLEEKALIAS